MWDSLGIFPQRSSGVKHHQEPFTYSLARLTAPSDEFPRPLAQVPDLDFRFCLQTELASKNRPAHSPAAVAMAPAWSARTDWQSAASDPEGNCGHVAPTSQRTRDVELLSSENSSKRSTSSSLARQRSSQQAGMNNSQSRIPNNGIECAFQ